MIFNVANKTNDFVYYCNGGNDSTLLQTFIANLRKKGLSNFTVEVVGSFKPDTTLTVDNTGYLPITLDFSKCNRITAVGAFMNAKNVRVVGCSVYHQNNASDVDVITFTGEKSVFENCNVTGAYRSGTCKVFSASGSTLRGCVCDVTNNDGLITGIGGNDNLVSECEISVTSQTASAYGIDVSGSFVTNSKFTGKTNSTLPTTSGNGGIGGGFYSNCKFIGIGALKGQGFFIRGGQWVTMINGVFRGYTKDITNGWGGGLMGQSNEATTASLLGLNCNQVEFSGYSQSKSFELLGGYGVYSGTFFTAPNVATTLTSLGSYNRNRT